MGALRNRMIREMQLRRFVPGTQEAYVHAVEGLAVYYGRSPDGIGSDEVKDYVHYLLEERRLKWSTVNLAVSGIRFFYSKVLGRDDVGRAIPPRRTPKRLPEILSGEELGRLFEAAENPKHRAMLMTAYAAGLRVSELVRLRIADIDSSRMMIRVRSGKREKDRYTILCGRLLEELRGYWRVVRTTEWLFPGARADRPITRSTAGSIYRRARDRAGITKHGGIHTLRHCFATHLLEAGVDIRTIQVLMGHSSIRTTIGYFQMTRKQLDATPSLLDLLDIPKTWPSR